MNDHADIPVLMGLEGEDGYPHKGTINFVNNQVNPFTSTIAVRGVFPNLRSPRDVRLLSPFIPERGKIQPRRISGTCAKHQRALQTAISRARQLALIPYVTD